MTLLKHAWRSITGNAKRTGLGTAPLVLLVVLVLVGVAGAEKGVRSFSVGIDNRGGAQILVTATPRDGLVSEVVRLAILQDLARDLRRNLTEIKTTVITQRRSPLVSFGLADNAADSFELQATLVTVDRHFAGALALEPAVGRLLSVEDFDSGFSIAVLGSQLAASYGIRSLNEGPLEIMLDGQPLLVVGVVAPSPRLPMLDWSLIVPRDARVLDALDSRGVAAQGSSSSSTLIVGSSITRLANDADVTSALARLFSGTEAAIVVDYQFNALRDFASGTNSLVTAIKLLLVVAAVGSALASLQLQTSAIKLRHRELGTRLAMGYSPASLRLMLLLEGLITTGGVVLVTAPILLAGASVGTSSASAIGIAYVAAVAVIAALTLSLPQVAVYRALRMHPYHLLVKV